MRMKNTFKSIMLILVFTGLSTLNSKVYSISNGLNKSTNKTIASGGAIKVTIPDVDLKNNLLFLFGAPLAPTTQAYSITFSNVTTTSMSISWTVGNGGRRAAFIKQANTGTASPVNATTYTASTTFGSGTQIGTSGWYCVYNGTGTSVAITGLTLGTDYIVQVFDYNGVAANPTFQTATSTDNPKSQTTSSCEPPVISSQSTAAQALCIGGTFTAISVTATGTNITYQWYSNTTASNSGGNNLGSANGATTNSYTPQTTLAGTLYYYCVVTGTGTCVTPQTSAISGAFIVYPASVGGSITGTSPVCYGSTSGLLTLSGHTGTVVKWQSSVSPYTSWSDITNINATYTSGALTQNTKFKVFVKNETCPNAQSTPYILTVDPLSVGGTVATDQTICSGFSPANLTLSGNTGSVVRWEKSSDLPTTIASTSTTLTGAIIGNLTQNTYIRAVVANGTCTETNSSSVLITVLPTLGGSISGATSICAGTNSTLLTLTSYSGSVVKWQQSTDNWITTTDILITTDTYTATNLSTTTKYRAVVANGLCAQTNSSVAIITVKANPNPNMSGDIAPCENSVGNIYRAAIGMSNYSWSVSSGGAITAGGGTTDRSVTVSWNTSGPQSIVVNITASNGCSATQTYNVTVATGTVTNTNTSLRYCTIQDAIYATQTLDGHVISVAPGIYSETIHVSKSLTIIGDPGDALPGPGTNAPIIDGTSLSGAAFKIDIGVTNVTIKGFEIRNFAKTLTSAGYGIAAFVDSTSNITVSDNYIHDIGYNGIHIGVYTNLGDHSNWVVKNNIVEKFGNTGIKLVNNSHSIIENNIIHVLPLLNPISAISVLAFRNESGIIIQNNQIDGAFSILADTVAAIIIGVVDSAYVPIQSNISFDSIYLTNNSIQTTGSFTQVYITDSLRGFVTNVHLSHNSLTSLRNYTNANIVATANWWGTAEGPYHVKYNICGTGDTVVGEVSFMPWYINSSMTTLSPVFTAGVINTTNETICYNGDPSEIGSSTAASGGVGTIEYQWQSSTTSSTAGFTDISGAISASYNPPSGLTINTWYRRNAKTSCYTEWIASTGTWSVTFNPLPTASISGTTAVCKDATSPDATFTGVGGTAPYTFTYNINTGSDITVTTTSGNSVTVSAPTSSDGTYTYTLVSVADANCSQTQTGDATITVNPLPTPSISGNISACINSTGNIYTTESSMTGYSWSIVGGTITSGADTNSITVTWNTEGAQSVSVNYTNGNSCSAASPTVYPVTVNPLPVPTISGSASACVNSTANVYTTESGMTSYSWSITGGTITNGSTTNSINVTWTSLGAQTISVNYTNTNSCTAATATVKNITVSQLPAPTISGATNLCNHTTGNIYTTEAGMTSYNWSVTGGTITAGTGTNAITVTWNTEGAQSVSVNYANANGCTAASATVYGVTLKSAPYPVITGSPSDTYIVPKLATYQYSTPLVVGDLYSWSSPKIEGYCSATARNCINVHFLDPCCVYGQWTISVTETNPATGCSTIATKLIYITP